MNALDPVLPMTFGLVALIYVGMAAYVSRSADDQASNSISILLMLTGAFVAGAALYYAATDLALFRIGRVLTLFAASFLPVAFYSLYRAYVGDRPSALLLGALSIIPAVTTGLALTNPWHGLVWEINVVDGAVGFSPVRQHAWFRLVSLPFSYTLFGYSLLALAGRLSMIARAHRSRVVILLVCAVLPFLVNVSNTLLDIGPYDFPFTATTLVGLLPVYWWATFRLSGAAYKPVAYKTLFDHVQDAILVLDDDQLIVGLNRRGEQLLEANEADLIGKPIHEVSVDIASEIRRAHGSYLLSTIRFDDRAYLDVSCGQLTGPNGESHGTVVVCRDITERRKTQQALKDSEQLIRSLVENSSNGMLRFARHGSKFRCVFANRAAADLLATGDRDLIGSVLDEYPVLDPEALLDRFGGSRSRRETFSPLELEVHERSADRWLKLVAESIGDDFSVMLVDITQNKATESRMQAEAFQDPLTGLLNRRGFEESAPLKFAESGQAAVVYLDLDQFKDVNDNFGHQAGDALLKAFGHRLAFCLRPEDVVCRLGGDEFSIMLPGISEENARTVAARIVSSAEEPYLIQGERIFCSASVGIALKPRHGDDFRQLIRLADEAMYETKARKRDEAANDGGAFGEATITG